MERFFLELLNRAICAGWLVLAILILRVILKKVPKWICCLLWGMVAVRLLVPIQIESPVSLIPSAHTVSPGRMYAENTELYTGSGAEASAFHPVMSDSFKPTPENSVNPLQVIMAIASWLWLAGASLMLIYAAVSFVRIRFLVRTAVLVCAENAEDCGGLSENVRRKRIPVFQSERVDSPFVLGLFRPRIYLPLKLRQADRTFIISHEAAHIQRKDHWIKPFGYLLLSVYWFHPLLWAAYIMLCRDIEYACDERVVKHYNVEERKAYSTALLTCSVRRMRIAACPVAFGEVGVRQRVKSVLHYKKPAFWALIAAAVVCAVVALCFLTNPKTDDSGQSAGGDGLQETEAENGETETENGEEGIPDTEEAGSENGTMRAAVPAEGSYVFDHCVFMNPLSSYFPQEGLQIGGYLDMDGLIWNEYGQQSRLSYQEASDFANVDTVPWATFEADELRELIYYGWEESQFEEVDAALEAIGALPEQKRLWRPLEDGGRLLYVDEELWLLRGKDNGVWSIYALRPQGDALDEAIANAAWDWAEETHAFGSVTKSGAAAEGVTGEQWAAYPCVSFCVLATERSLNAADGGAETITVYAHVLAAAYLCEQTGITDLGGSYVPAVLTFSVGDDGSYTLLQYWTPREGSYYVEDIREKCAAPIADEMIDGQRYIYALIKESYAKAISETGVVDSRAVVAELFDRMLEDDDGLLPQDADAVERMAVYPLTVRELYYYGEYTLRYIFNRFMQGGESGLRGELLARVMNELISEEIQLRMPLTDGQAYFDALCQCVQADYEDLVKSQGGEEGAALFMRDRMPSQYLLLSMLKMRTSDTEAAVRYEYYLTKDELMADIEQGSIFRLDTTFQKTSGLQGENSYPAPYVSLGSWPFYVHEDNTVNLEISFANLIRKPSKQIFPDDERVVVEVVSPDGQSAYRFEKWGDEITEDVSVTEQISVTPGEWTLKISFAYVCGEIPAHFRIAAFYETPSKEDKDWLIGERLSHGTV